ncbi:L-serine ammonia-lyase, iron-sulfur-dependent, subunit alpha [Caloranaerobacter azorensis]|uniref:L-serine dehydratase n=1 Tax=Caloranaerobacter azorensis TaxID=116090 RepID=A0A6P1YAU0_9FIRM|nr:L-serine ammonia-lyase, iron-sulfur-dependent, subunit alpha [Caloranaerobacter azorensis]QIB26399.1 L-serine ammonia-lyase, iron-sulfur-dependent, subunit alpha [Caloranaerobacter azorensis]
MFNTGKELLKIANEKGLKLWEIVLENEAQVSEIDKKELRNKMKENLVVMKEASTRSLENDINSISGLIGGDAKKVENYRKNKKTLCGDVINKAMARALSCSEVNAAMGKIVAAPTAGSCGIIPSVIFTAAEILNANEEDIINALFTAAGIGQIIAKNATISGAEGGCQAECGAASAMAAAAVVEMAGGTPEMSLHAAAIAIKNILGLVCDPIAGLVEVPCALRNASGATNALISADLALAGVKSIIPFDEVVEAMYNVGRALPVELRETALGGLAATPTGKKLMKEILK